MDTKRFIARQVVDLPKSGIRDFFEIVSKMKDVISLGIGEPDFDTPWHIREAAIYALEKGKTHYTSNLGHIELRRAIGDYVGTHYGIDYEPEDEMIVTVGVSESIDLILRALINPGDKVLYHQPVLRIVPPERRSCPRRRPARDDEGRRRVRPQCRGPRTGLAARLQGAADEPAMQSNGRNLRQGPP